MVELIENMTDGLVECNIFYTDKGNMPASLIKDRNEVFFSRSGRKGVVLEQRDFVPVGLIEKFEFEN